MTKSTQRKPRETRLVALTNGVRLMPGVAVGWFRPQPISCESNAGRWRSALTGSRADIVQQIRGLVSAVVDNALPSLEAAVGATPDSIPHLLHFGFT